DPPTPRLSATDPPELHRYRPIRPKVVLRCRAFRRRIPRGCIATGTRLDCITMWGSPFLQSEARIMHTFRSLVSNLMPLIFTVLLGSLLAAATPRIAAWAERQVSSEVR